MPMKYDMIEFFSGDGNAARAFREDGKQAATFEFQDDPRTQDFMSAAGFAQLGTRQCVSLCAVTIVQMSMHLRLAIHLVLSAVPNGLMLLAPECGSWTVISRGSTWRSVVNWHGMPGVQAVAKGNMMMARCLGLHVCMT